MESGRSYRSIVEKKFEKEWLEVGRKFEEYGYFRKVNIV